VAPDPGVRQVPVSDLLLVDVLAEWASTPAPPEAAVL
jgi:hypothetical protein